MRYLILAALFGLLASCTPNDANGISLKRFDRVQLVRNCQGIKKDTTGIVINFYITDVRLAIAGKPVKMSAKCLRKINE